MKKGPRENPACNFPVLKDDISKTQEKIYRIVEKSLDLICVLNKAGIFVMVTSSCEKLLGYKKDELIGRCCGEFILEEDKDRTLSIGEVIANGGKITDFTNRYIRKDGSVITLMWSAILDQEDELMYCIGRDITELRKAQEELAKSNERFYYASKATSDVIWDWDIHSNFLSWGENYYTVFGYKIERENNHISDWYIRIHPSDCKRIVDGINEAIRSTTTNWKDKYRYKKADGTYRWVVDRGIILRDEMGKALRMIGAMKDITDNKKAKEMLRLSEQRFRSLVQDGSDLIGIINPDGDYIYVSSSVEHVLGYTPEYFLGKNAFQFIHPDDIEKTVLGLKSIIARKAVVLEPFRFLDSKGEWRWVETKLTDQLDNEAIRGIVCNSRDITDKKNNEDKLRSLAVLAKETINGVTISDPYGNITWANESFLNTYGFAMSEVIGKNSENLLAGAKTRKEKLEQIRYELNEQKMVEIELIFYTKEGRPRIIELQIQPLFDKSGITTSYFALHHDITDKRLLQSKLQREVRKKQQMIAKAVLAAQEKDREQIAHELHDNVNQILTTVKLYLEICRTDKNANENLIPNSIQLVNKAVEEIRQISHSLSYNSVKEMTLNEALCDLVDSANLTKKCRIELRVDDFDDNNLTADLKLSVYRIVQEQLNNTLKHAQATTLDISLTKQGNSLLVNLSDNGKGFDMEARRNGIGLSNIESRVFAYSGKMDITTSPGKGCQMFIEFPSVFKT